MRKIIMIGGGGFAREVLDTIDEMNKHTDNSISTIGFVYDGGDKDRGNKIHNIPVLGDISYLEQVDLNEVYLTAPIGSPIRKNLIENAIGLGGKFIDIIHPSSQISKWCRIGEGAIIQSNCLIMPEIKIGNYCVFNDNVIPGHDSIIGDFVNINPNVNISGGAIIGNEVFIGVKATILRVTVGDRAVIGACALITKDVPENVVAMGIPAKYYDKKDKQY